MLPILRCGEESTVFIARPSKENGQFKLRRLKNAPMAFGVTNGFLGPSTPETFFTESSRQPLEQFSPKKWVHWEPTEIFKKAFAKYPVAIQKVFWHLID